MKMRGGGCLLGGVVAGLLQGETNGEAETLVEGVGV